MNTTINTSTNTKKPFPLKAGLLALVAGSVLLIGQVQAGNPESAGQGMSQGECKGECKGEHNGKHHRGHHSGMFNMLRHLDLTDAQKAEVKIIVEKYKQAKTDRPTQEEREAHRTQVLSLITQAGFDDSAAQNLVSEKQQRHQATMVNKLKMQNEVYQLLNDEQKAKFSEKFTNMATKQGRR
jgi:protein CpxP